jgi:uncharacterized surface protein with fasciclin (FAS1) repeats
MNFKSRTVRFAAALTLAGIISAQIPMHGGSAIAADGYTNTVDDNSGNFLGINNLSNKDVITGVTFGLVAYAVATTLRDAKSAAAASSAAGGSSAGGAAGGGAAPGGTQLPVVAGDSNKPIYDVAASNSADFSGVKGLIDQTDLPEALRTEGPFTFFAPTNAAVGGVPAATLSALSGDKAKLKAFLQKHVVVGRYTIDDLKAFPEGKALLTLSGETVTISKAGGTLKINGVPIVENDIAASNGWIHPISGVIQ